MRTSSRENNGSFNQLLGYFMGAREFFPQGTFEETELVVTLDPIWQSSDGIREVVLTIGSMERKLQDLNGREKHLVSSIADDRSYWRPSPKTKQLHRQELKTLRREVVDLKGEMDELRAIIG